MNGTMSVIADHLPLFAMITLLVAAAAVALLFIFRHGTRIQAALATLSAIPIIYFGAVFAIENGYLGPFSGEYDERSVAEFTRMCDRWCTGHGRGSVYCKGLCDCIMDDGQDIISYDEMLNSFRGKRDYSVDTRVQTVISNCNYYVTR